MAWQYRTILFEFAKNGLLGDKYVDDEEIEKILNEMGVEGWELINVVLLQDGLLAFLKMGFGARMREEREADDADTVQVIAPLLRQPHPPVDREPIEAEEAQAGERARSLHSARQRPDALHKQEPDFFDDIRIS